MKKDSKAKMSKDTCDIRFKVFQPDNLIGVTEKRLMELLAMEMELIAAREVVGAARRVLDLEAKGNKKYSDFLAHRSELESSFKKYDEARQA